MRIKQHTYRVDPFRLMHICKEVEDMLENRISEPSLSQWSLPTFYVVPKPNGSYRFCINFHRVNAVTKTDSFPIPCINDCINRIGHAKYVSLISSRDIGRYHLPSV